MLRRKLRHPGSPAAGVLQQVKLPRFIIARGGVAFAISPSKRTPQRHLTPQSPAAALVRLRRLRLAAHFARLTSIRHVAGNKGQCASVCGVQSPSSRYLRRPAEVTRALAEPLSPETPFRPAPRLQRTGSLEGGSLRLRHRRWQQPSSSQRIARTGSAGSRCSPPHSLHRVQKLHGPVPLRKAHLPSTQQTQALSASSRAIVEAAPSCSHQQGSGESLFLGKSRGKAGGRSRAEAAAVPRHLLYVNSSAAESVFDSADFVAAARLHTARVAKPVCGTLHITQGAAATSSGTACLRGPATRHAAW